MKNLLLAATAAVLLATPTLAQTNTAPFADPLERTQGNQSHLGGDNQRAGGPAQSRREGFGAPYGDAEDVVVVPGTTLVDPVETGTIVVVPGGQSVPGATTGDPFSRTQGNNVGAGGDLVPSFQQGDNQQAGGPADELNSQTGIPGRR